MSPDIEKRNKLKVFFETEYNKLVNYIQRSQHQFFFEDQPEDIIQDVALNIYSKLDINTPIENLAGYFYRSVKNRITDLQRRRRRTVSIEDFNDDRNENRFLDFAEEMDNDDILNRNGEVLRKMMEAIGRLSPDQEAIIMETEFEGHSFEELSKRWNIPVGTLLSRKHRAMAKLHRILEGEIKEKDD